MLVDQPLPLQRVHWQGVRSTSNFKFGRETSFCLNLCWQNKFEPEMACVLVGYPGRNSNAEDGAGAEGKQGEIFYDEPGCEAKASDAHDSKS